MSAADVLAEKFFGNWHTSLEAHFGQDLLEPVSVGEQARCVQHHSAQGQDSCMHQTAVGLF